MEKQRSELEVLVRGISVLFKHPAANGGKASGQLRTGRNAGRVLSIGSRPVIWESVSQGGSATADCADGSPID